MLRGRHFRPPPQPSPRRRRRSAEESGWSGGQVSPPVASERTNGSGGMSSVSVAIKHKPLRTNSTKAVLLAAIYVQMAVVVVVGQQQQQQHQRWSRWPTQIKSDTKQPLPGLSERTPRPRNSSSSQGLTNEWIPMRPAPRPRDPETLATAASFGRRHWRRPRFQQHLRLHHEPVRKLYRRVLLCEKTLVSLDYLRLQMRPTELDNELGGHLNDDVGDHDDEGAADAPDNFLDNFIDNSAESSRRLGRSHPAHHQRANRSLADPLRFAQSRSYLTDEDPLVKCDMWDLEKGLKSRKPPEEALRMAVRADFDTVRDAINRCRQLTEKTLPPDDEFGRDGLEVMSTDDLVSLFSMKRGLIPGTKWCGLGDQASSYNDLGPKHRIDICCRAHDHCPIRLKPFRNDYGVLNLALYTKSHCDCDADFYRCLREAHSRTADMLGNLYFNVMKLQCMREERQKVCREMKPLPLGFERCIRYEDSPVKRVFRFTGPPVAY